MIGKGKSISHGTAALEYDLAKEIDGHNTKDTGFLFEGSASRILPVFFFMSFRSGAFLAKKVTGRLYL